MSVIRAGALGGGLPRRDLRVSPCHAMALDGMPPRVTDGYALAGVRRRLDAVASGFRLAA